MNDVVRALAACLVFVLTVGAATAQIPDWSTPNEIVRGEDNTYTIRGTFTAQGDPGSLHEKAYVLIGFEGQLQLGLLAGDPVVSFRMRFQPLGGRVTIPNFDPGASEYNTIGLGQIPTAALETIDLNNVRVAFQFMEQTNEMVIVEDSGVFFGQGQWSFNVPDGYSWRNVFYDGGFGKLDYSAHPHVSEDRAREIWDNGIALDAFEVIHADLLLSDLHWWYRQHDTSSAYFATLRAIDYVRQGIELSYRYDTSGALEADLLEARSIAGNAIQAVSGVDIHSVEQVSQFGDQPDHFGDFEAATEALNRILDKLMNLPGNLKLGDNHRPYEVAVQTVPSILGEATRFRQQYRPSGRSNDSIPRGYEPRFGGEYGVDVDEDGSRWVVSLGTEERLTPMDSDQHLINGAYLIRATSRDCNNGSATFHYRDPASREDVGSYEIPCSGHSVSLNASYQDNSSEPTFSVVIWQNGTREETYQVRSSCSGHMHDYYRTFRDGTTYALTDRFEIGSQLGSAQYKLEDTYVPLYFCAR